MLYGEDVYVGYRYYDTLEVEPSFPFGHGLSYTTFELSNLQLRKSSNRDLTVECTLANTGSRPGAEVVQVYVAPVSPPLKRPQKELKAFTKVTVSNGESRPVKIPLDLVRATSYWDEYSNSWCSHSGSYNIMVGTSSRGVFLESSVGLDETTFWQGL